MNKRLKIALQQFFPSFSYFSRLLCMKGNPNKATTPLCPARGGRQSLGSQVPCQGTAEAWHISSGPCQRCTCIQPPSCPAAALASKNRCFALHMVGEDFLSLISKDIPHGWSNPDLKEIRSNSLASAEQFTPTSLQRDPVEKLEGC